MQFFLGLFLLSLLLIRLPPLVIPFPFFYLTTHAVFRLINLTLLFFILKGSIKAKKKYTFHNQFLCLSLIYFISQALSVLGAQNIPAYLTQFEKLISAFIFLLVSFHIIQQEKRLIKVIFAIIIITTGLNAFTELLIFFSPYFASSVLKIILHSNVVEILILNLNRERLFFEYYGEVTIPLILYFLFRTNIKKSFKALLLMLLIGVVLLSFWSNFRGRFLVTVFALIGYLISFGSDTLKHWKTSITVFLILIIVTFFGSYYIAQTRGFSIIDRFLLTDKEEDINSLYFREKLFGYAYDMGTANLLFGVGVGNFFEHVPQGVKNQVFSLSGDRKTLYKSTYLYPHNIIAQIFAETGLFGAISFAGLCLYFLKRDIQSYRRNLMVNKALALSSWALFVYSLFNPPSSLTFFSNFFLLRASIELNYEKILS